MVWITPPDFGFIMKQSAAMQMQIDRHFKRTSMNSNEPPEEKTNKIQKLQVTNNQKRNAVSPQQQEKCKELTFGL